MFRWRRATRGCDAREQRTADKCIRTMQKEAQYGIVDEEATAYVALREATGASFWALVRMAITQAKKEAKPWN